MTRLLIIVFGAMSLQFFGQIHWNSIPDQRIENDSIRYTLTTRAYYNYFYQKVDSIIKVFDSGPAVEVYQTLIIDKINKNGTLKILYQNRVLCSYNVKNEKIEGLGAHFNSFSSSASKIAFEQGTFRNGRLHGLYLYSDWDSGQIKTVLKYRKGKLKRVLFAENYQRKYWRKIHNYPGLK